MWLGVKHRALFLILSTQFEQFLKVRVEKWSLVCFTTKHSKASVTI